MEKHDEQKLFSAHTQMTSVHMGKRHVLVIFFNSNPVCSPPHCGCYSSYNNLENFGICFAVNRIWRAQRPKHILPIHVSQMSASNERRKRRKKTSPEYSPRPGVCVRHRMPYDLRCYWVLSRYEFILVFPFLFFFSKSHAKKIMNIV